MLERDPFQRSGDDLLALDPLFHWVLHCGRDALRQAGHDGTPTDRASVILGNLSFPSRQMSRYAEHVWFDRASVDPRNRFMSGLPVHMLAEEQGLGGGSFALDAACASSLYAIKLAADQLHDRRVDLALAGAVCHSDDLFIHVGFCALDAMSRTGRSRPFHAHADGLVPAEGCAVLALKRLSDAISARDRIFGVIRGVGLSNDGRGRGLLAPDAGGQARALRSAWSQSGVDPSRLSLVECHATGTPVGDATEIHTLQDVFGNSAALPLGSLKSNLGHLITAAGAAAVIKMLGAMDAGVRPPTLHAEPRNPALDETPFRLVTEAEPWHSDGPRVAGINAFGFGGNNAHVILEQYDGAAPTVAPAPRTNRDPVAVVGIGFRGPGIDSAFELQQALQDGRSRVTGRRAALDRLALPLRGLRFPPKDLEQSLAQQVSVLAAAMEAVGSTELPRERTAVLIGSQADPEVCRYGARWRIAEWFAERDESWIAGARDAVIPVLRSAGVVGNMPNIPANRIGSQFDLGGPGFTVAAEEQSGLWATQVAMRMLRTHEIDVALTGAVDLSAEPVHEAAASALLPPAPTGDAAVVLVLKREADARRDGDSILALIHDEGASPTLTLGDEGLDLSRQLGRAHAAHAAVHLAAAVLACASALRPTDHGPAAEWTGARIAEVACTGLAGSRQSLWVHAAGPDPIAPPVPDTPTAAPLTFAAHPPEIRMPPHPHDPAPPERMASPPSVVPTTEDGPALVGGPTGFESEPRATMAAPPAVQRITTLPPATPSASSSPPLREPSAPTAVPAAIPRPRGSASVPPPAAAPASSVAAHHLAELAALHRRLSDAHQAFLTQQHAMHARFLQVRLHTQNAMVQALRQRGQLAGSPSGTMPSAPPLAPTPPAVAPPPVVPTAPATPPPAVAPVAPVPVPSRPAVLPGPKFSRQQLEKLASDKISTVLGDLFSIQDSFPRQVRMPEPPLLLADRVTGIDAEPGSMTTGTIWTETDVTWDAWYLHDGTMPAGVMIEAGQADLLLISYLGADFRNRGKRVYRLLGCQLTYQGGLPRPEETLHYEIHIDGHANMGETSIFFFHYDCTDDEGARACSSAKVRPDSLPMRSSPSRGESSGTPRPGSSSPTRGSMHRAFGAPARRSRPSR